MFKSLHAEKRKWEVFSIFKSFLVPGNRSSFKESNKIIKKKMIAEKATSKTVRYAV